MSASTDAIHLNESKQKNTEVKARFPVLQHDHCAMVMNYKDHARGFIMNEHGQVMIMGRVEDVATVKHTRLDGEPVTTWNWSHQSRRRDDTTVAPIKYFDQRHGCLNSLEPSFWPRDESILDIVVAICHNTYGYQFIHLVHEPESDSHRVMGWRDITDVCVSIANSNSTIDSDLKAAGLL